MKFITEPVKIKDPFSCDVSHWKIIPDFKKIEPRPVVMMTKATEAYPGSPYNHTDDKFLQFAEGMMEINCIRGFYHFSRKELDVTKQVKHFLNVISQIEILKQDILILDAEEEKQKASFLWAFFEGVKKVYPDNLLMLYSSKAKLDQIIMTEAEKAYFRKIFTWPAGYPYFPDLFSSIPNSKTLSYVPDQTKYGPPLFWQYSEVGTIKGIKGAVDLNWISPQFQAMLPAFQLQIGETMATSFKAVCKNANGAKVWKDVGLVQIDTVQYNDTVRGTAEKTVSNIVYIFVTTLNNKQGWTRKDWFNVTYDTIPDPEPPPPPPDPVVMPSYLTAHDENGNILGYYDKRIA